MTHFSPLCTKVKANVSNDIIVSNISNTIRRKPSFIKMGTLKEKPLSLVAGGPSLVRYWPHILIDYNVHDIMALNNTYKFLLGHEIVPDYFALLDAKEEKRQFLMDALGGSRSSHQKRALKDTEHYIADQCHPAVLDFLEQIGAKTQSYLTDNDYNIRHINEYPIDDECKYMISGGPTIGSRALALGIMLGYRKFTLYGYDSSFEGDRLHAYAQANKKPPMEIKIEGEGKSYFTVPAMAAQAAYLPPFISLLQNRYGAEINFRCDGLLPDLIKYKKRN